MTSRLCVVLTMAALAACSPDPRGARRPPAASTPVPSAAASAVTAASSLPSSRPTAPAPANVAPSSPFEVVLSQSMVRADDDEPRGFEWLPVKEGLLVVSSPLPKAFLVNGASATELPNFFDGIRGPAPDAPDYFVVYDLRGRLDSLTFTISAPSTEYRDEISGRPGHWRTRSGLTTGSKGTQPDWVSPFTISKPFTTAKGARIYQVAPGYQSPASEGFSFRFEGPSKGEALPRLTRGSNGCRYAMRGHPFMTQLDDGTLVGIGTLCAAGSNYISTALYKGVAPPDQYIVPRFAEGQVAAEHWKGGKSVVHPLPGIEQVASFASFELARRGPHELYVVTERSVPDRTEAYVGLFDGAGWHDVTPPDPPERLTSFVSSTNELYVLHSGASFRRNAAGWERIFFERSQDCAPDVIYRAAESPAGDIFAGGALGCLWQIAKGSLEAKLVPLPNGEFVGEMLAHQGEFYLIGTRAAGDTLLRLEH